MPRASGAGLRRPRGAQKQGQRRIPPDGVVVNKHEKLQKVKVTPHDLDIVLEFSASGQWEVICTEPEVLEVESDEEKEEDQETERR